MGDLYGPGVKYAITSVLQERQSKGERPAILDVGSGSGVW